MIGTKWVFKNKMNEQGEFVRNKAILVCKSYSQQKGIDYEQTYALVARRIFLSYAMNKKSKVYKMDVVSPNFESPLKLFSSFLNLKPHVNKFLVFCSF